MKILSRAEIVDRFRIAEPMWKSWSAINYNNKDVDMNVVFFIGGEVFYTDGAFALTGPVLDGEGEVAYSISNEINNENPIIQLDRNNLTYIKKDEKKAISLFSYLPSEPELQGKRLKIITGSSLVSTIKDAEKGFKTNKVIFRKEDLLSNINRLYGNEIKNKEVEAMVFQPDYENNILICKARRYKKIDTKRAAKLGTFEIPIYTDSLFSYGVKNPKDRYVAIQVKYLDLLRVFEEDEYIQMTFNMIMRDPKKRVPLDEYRSMTLGYVKFEGYGDDNPKFKMIVGQVVPNFDIFE